MLKFHSFLAAGLLIASFGACGMGGGGDSTDTNQSGDSATTADAIVAADSTVVKDSTVASDVAVKTDNVVTTDTTITTDTAVEKDTTVATDTTVEKDTTVVADTTVTDPGTTTTCSGSCTETDPNSCLSDGTSVCYCDTDAGEFASVACSDVCSYYGGTGTTCKTTADGADCDCQFDCADSTAVDTQCSNGIYTPCTCAAANPCSWIGDEYCDGEACDEAFPDQENLDDSATDCG